MIEAAAGAGLAPAVLPGGLPRVLWGAAHRIARRQRWRTAAERRAALSWCRTWRACQAWIEQRIPEWLRGRILRAYLRPLRDPATGRRCHRAHRARFEWCDDDGQIHDQPLSYLRVLIFLCEIESDGAAGGVGVGDRHPKRHTKDDRSIAGLLRVGARTAHRAILWCQPRAPGCACEACAQGWPHLGALASFQPPPRMKESPHCLVTDCESRPVTIARKEALEASLRREKAGLPAPRQVLRHQVAIRIFVWSEAAHQVKAIQVPEGGQDVRFELAADRQSRARLGDTTPAPGRAASAPPEYRTGLTLAAGQLGIVRRFTASNRSPGGEGRRAPAPAPAPAPRQAPQGAPGEAQRAPDSPRPLDQPCGRPACPCATISEATADGAIRRLAYRAIHGRQAERRRRRP